MHAYIESFNGKFRDECLNDHYFNNLEHARAVIAAWRRDYNEVRPHSAVGRIPPAEFAARYRFKVEQRQRTEDRLSLQPWVVIGVFRGCG
jgi:putative transposase